MINWISFFDQSMKNDFKTFDKIREIATYQDDNYRTGCLLDYPYLKQTTKTRCRSKSNKTNWFYWNSQ